MKLPFIGDDLLAPVATDLSTHAFLSLGWTKFRSSGGSTLHCRLGGEASGGEIVPVEENRSVITMVTGESAPQPPVPGSGAFGPGASPGTGRSACASPRGCADDHAERACLFAPMRRTIERCPQVARDSSGPPPGR